MADDQLSRIRSYNDIVVGIAEKLKKNPNSTSSCLFLIRKHPGIFCSLLGDKEALTISKVKGRLEKNNLSGRSGIVSAIIIKKLKVLGHTKKSFAKMNGISYQVFVAVCNFMDAILYEYFNLKGECLCESYNIKVEKLISFSGNNKENDEYFDPNLTFYRKTGYFKLTEAIEKSSYKSYVEISKDLKITPAALSAIIKSSFFVIPYFYNKFDVNFLEYEKIFNKEEVHYFETADGFSLYDMIRYYCIKNKKYFNFSDFPRQIRNFTGLAACCVSAINCNFINLNSLLKEKKILLENPFYVNKKGGIGTQVYLKRKENLQPKRKPRISYEKSKSK